MKNIKIGVTFHYKEFGNGLSKELVVGRDVEVKAYKDNNELYHATNGLYYGKIQYDECKNPVDAGDIYKYLKPAMMLPLDKAEETLKARAERYCMVGPYVAEITPLRRMIWSSDGYSDLEKEIETNKEEFGLDDDANEYEVYNRAVELSNEYLDDEISNLSSIKSDSFVAVGTVVRWNGAGRAYKVLDKAGNLGEAITEVMSSFGGDNSFEIYVEGKDLYVVQYGHDNPTNPSVIKIRVARKELLDGEDFEYVDDLLYNATDEELEKRTESVSQKVLDVYGVEMKKLADYLSKEV